MREIIDREILELFEGLFANFAENADDFLLTAQALCAIFMFIYFGIKSFGMMTGDEPLEIMPLIRPFILGMVIIGWVTFIDIINVPSKAIAKAAKGMLDDNIDEVNLLQKQRMELLSDVADKLIKDSAELEKYDDGDQETLEIIGIDLGSIFDTIKGYYIIVLSKFRYLAIEIIEFIMISFFQGCSYIVFFLQIIFSAVLIIFGPFSFALSVLPIFHDTYVTWLARYISVSLYTGIGYVIMSLSMSMLTFCLQKEIVVLQKAMADEAYFFAYITTNYGGANFYVVALITGGLGMLTIPIISTWIINTTGVGNAISAVARGASAGMVPLK